MIDKNPLMYFAPGNYNFYAFEKENVFELPNGWGMYGRAADYKAPKLGGDRPLFDGALVISPGSEQTTLNSIKIMVAVSMGLFIIAVMA